MRIALNGAVAVILRRFTEMMDLGTITLTKATINVAQRI